MCNKCNGNCNSCDCTCNSPCVTPDCACPVLVSSDCVNKITEDLVCSNILKGQTLTEVLVQLDAFICAKFGSITEFLNLINVGSGAKIYKGINMLGKKQIRSLVEGNLIKIEEGEDEITISVDEDALNAFIIQNNFVRQIAINENYLPSNYSEQDICDYILTLPSSQRTILDTDSKWNIVIFSASS